MRNNNHRYSLLVLLLFLSSCILIVTASADSFQHRLEQKISSHIAKAVSNTFSLMPNRFDCSKSYLGLHCETAESVNANIESISDNEQKTTRKREIEEETESQDKARPTNYITTPDKTIRIRPDFNFYGMLDIKDSLIPLYVPDENTNPQTIVNAQDAAALINNFIIADHNNQGFNCLSAVEIGDAATIARTQGKQVFQCVDILDGTNENGFVRTNDGRDICFDMDEYDIIMYTCAPTIWERRSVLITCWNIIGP